MTENPAKAEASEETARRMFCISEADVRRKVRAAWQARRASRLGSAERGWGAQAGRVARIGSEFEFSMLRSKLASRSGKVK